MELGQHTDVHWPFCANKGAREMVGCAGQGQLAQDFGGVGEGREEAEGGIWVDGEQVEDRPWACEWEEGLGPGNMQEPNPLPQVVQISLSDHLPFPVVVLVLNTAQT